MCNKPQFKPMRGASTRNPHLPACSEQVQKTVNMCLLCGILQKLGVAYFLPAKAQRSVDAILTATPVITCYGWQPKLPYPWQFRPVTAEAIQGFPLHRSGK
jgi:hypothetical protein